VHERNVATVLRHVSRDDRIEIRIRRDELGLRLVVATVTPCALTRKLEDLSHRRERGGDLLSFGIRRVARVGVATLRRVGAARIRACGARRAARSRRARGGRASGPRRTRGTRRGALSILLRGGGLF